MNFTRRSTRIVSSVVAGLSIAALGGGIASAAAPSPQEPAASIAASSAQEPLTWMQSQRIRVGENGTTTVVLNRQVGDRCTTIGTSANSTTVECTDIEWALVGPMVEVHMNNTVTADITETKTGSINYGVNYQTSAPGSSHVEAGNIGPGAHASLSTPDAAHDDWMLDLNGQFLNSGTVRITLTTNG